jgi:hypothetical protein
MKFEVAHANLSFGAEAHICVRGQNGIGVYKQDFHAANFYI